MPTKFVTNPRRSFTTVAHTTARRTFKPKTITRKRLLAAVDKASIAFWSRVENELCPHADYLDKDDDVVVASEAYMLDAVEKWIRDLGFRVQSNPMRRNGASDRMQHATEGACVDFWVSIEASFPEVYDRMERTPFAHATMDEVEEFNGEMLKFVKKWYAEYCGASSRTNPRRKNPDAATPRAFLSVLRSKLTQYDVKLSAKQPNMYRLGHYLAAAERVEKDMGKSLDSTSPAALEKLRLSLHKRFVMPFAPASAVERQIDAYLAKGTMPSLVRKNPPTGFRIAGPAVKTMSESLRISKADAQRLKDMMDTGAPRILQAADKMMNGHGVERISGVGGGLMYVNMGDTYDTTLIYDYKTNRFVVSSWGDIVERQPRRFED